MTFITPELPLEAYRGKHILVTGSTGYLANSLIHLLKNVDCKITRVARSGKILTLLEGQCKIFDIISDLTNPALWQQILPSIDLVFHFAGQANIVQANEAPAEDIQHSIIPLLQLLDGCRKMALKPHVVLASSVSLYGYPNTPETDETYPDKPQSIYDLHKLHCEEYLRYFIKHHELTGCALRLGNVYGPGVHTNQFYHGLINYAIYCGLQHEPIPLHSDGESSRDYLYLDDASRAFLAAGLLPQKVNDQTYIVSSGADYTTQVIIEKVKKELQNSRGISLETTKTEIEIAAQIRHFRGSYAKFYQATGWEPLTTVEQGITQTIAAY
ncbi:MAG: NAD(P)-dependent oxidoreductase [Gammaproteobacteria bacterium]|nr:NAD(P)-dependent oxidoreductase [Gammaproteobacteria bacterium]